MSNITAEDKEQLFEDLRQSRSRWQKIRQELNELEEHWHHMHAECDKAYKEYQAQIDVLNYCLEHDVDPTYAKIMLSNQAEQQNEQATNTTGPNKSTRVTGFTPLTKDQWNEFNGDTEKKSSRIAAWWRKLYNK